MFTLSSQSEYPSHVTLKKEKGFIRGQGHIKYFSQKQTNGLPTSCDDVLGIDLVRSAHFKNFRVVNGKILDSHVSIDLLNHSESNVVACAKALPLSHRHVEKLLDSHAVRGECRCLVTLA